MDRRRFLRASFIFTAGLFVPKTGILRPAEARWPALSVASSPGPNYRDWAETREDALGADQDGDGTDDTICFFMENTTLNGNEVGTGADLTGADATLTYHGTTDVTGATGAPPRRSLLGNGGFHAPASMINAIFCGTSTWTYIVKTRGYTWGSAAHGWLVFYNNETGNALFMLYNSSSSGKLNFKVKDRSIGSMEYEYTSEAMNMANAGWYYIGAYCNGVDPARAFFCTQRPTSWAAIPSGQKVEVPTLIPNWVTNEWNPGAGHTGGKFILSSADDVGTNVTSPVADVYHVIMSKACLVGA